MYKKVYVCECKVSSRHDISFYFLTPLGKRRGENSLWKKYEDDNSNNDHVYMYVV